jgi:MurNAc alpha-1-phosphate uridylyltransferase
VNVKSAMVLAAGRGVRMRPLTLDRPKPLVSVAGKLLIDYAVDALKRAGVERIVVNTHHFPDQMAAWARQRSDPGIMLSDESDLLLDTGGGVVRALPLLGRAPFFVINSDSFWRDGPEPALDRLASTANGWMRCCCSAATIRRWVSKGRAISTWTRSAA